MSPALLLVVLLATGQSAGTGTKDCWTSCQRHVLDSAQRARVCRACLPGGRVDAWVGALEGMRPSNRDALVSARKDADWRVRWAAVRAEARLRGITERRLLAEWVSASPAAADLDACLTAARAAAEAGQSSADFLKDAGARGPDAAARVWARRDAIRKALELELYAEDLKVRGVALAHLSGFLGRRPARVVLDALETRPEAGDAITAGALKVVAERKRTSVGRLLLDEARPADEARVNRLFAVYSRELEALQADLSGAGPLQRRKAVQALRVYGPLARRELEQSLGDADRQVRQDAARVLAEVEGLSLRQAAERRLATKDAAAARPWLEAMVHEKGCAAFFVGTARDRALPAALRGDALAQLADCDEGSRERLGTLTPYLRDSEALVRAGAVRVLGVLPARNPEVAEATSHALEDPAPEVVAAALEVVGGHRLSPRGDDAAVLLDSEHPVVRAAAAKALEHIGRPAHVKGLAVCLRQDPVSAVRVAAAQALVRIGGPHAAAALSDAAARDADTHVQHVSREGLRRLGFGL
ncbi:HEAT repeat domain-containing protein [Pyxidicoccus trucidator]|uniref:HEAT repeat domain-containing protein n=1 Tax=Pyxidicoccus trucidator TaxID=2709662 RepID=UPI001967C987|nr:HEAT repeat domain-containing protein [Pyxidicoccus trucidator]